MMEIVAKIPVEKVIVPGGYTFRYESHTVRVLRVMRYRADKFRERFYYHADIADHPAMHPEAVRIGVGRVYRTHIDRKLNPRWKPPVFPAGANHVGIEN